MFLSLFTHTSGFILLFFVIGIKQICTQDATENNEKGKVNELRKIVTRAAPYKPQQISCHVLADPMDRIKSALKDLELMNELYCSGGPNTPPVETSRVDTQDESQINPDQELTAQYHHGHNPNLEPDPLGQRTINYPLHYNQPWINYPSVYPYNYADRAGYQNPSYYYSGRSPYALYPSNPQSSQPQSLSMVGGTSDHHASPQGIPAEIPSATDDNEDDDISTLKKKARKYDRHCGKKRMSKRVESPKIEDSDYISSLNDTEFDISNSTEVKSN